MLGKLIVTLLLLGALFFGAVWLFTGQTPSQFVHSITASRTTDSLSSSNARDLVYSYKVVVGKHREVYRFDVAVHVVKRTSSQLCYSYKVASVEQGDPSFVRDFMYGYQGYTAENQVICVDLNADNVDLSTYFTDPGRTGSVDISSANGAGKAYVENGVLRSLEYNYTVSYKGENIPVKLSIHLLKGAKTTSRMENTRQTSTVTGQEENRRLSSANVKTLYYRFTWKIAKVDMGTGRATGDYLTRTFNVKVDIVDRQGSRICLKYSIANASTTGLDQAMAQLWPYPPGKTVCTAPSDTAAQIPYFLFPPTTTKTQTFSGENMKGVAVISHGILKLLKVDSLMSIGDADGTETRIPVKLIVELVKAEG